MENFEFPEDYVNPRNIPQVSYISDVAAYVKNGGGADTVISNLLVESSKYEHMEKRLVGCIANLDYKIPTIKKTLKSLEFLRKQLEKAEQPHGSGEEPGVRSYYCLTDSVFGEAIVKPQRTVHLWMGAKVMVEYTFEEATTLLNKNLSNAEVNMRNTKEDLAWLQQQITNLQINISRVYNYDLKNKQKKNGEEEVAEK